MPTGTKRLFRRRGLGWLLPIFGYDCRDIEDATRYPAGVRRLYVYRAISQEQFGELCRSLINVKEITIGWQAWTELPIELGQLHALRSFAVLNMPLLQFPSFLVNCKNLRRLTIRGTDIRDIPDSIGRFAGLRYFDCSNCHQLESVSERLGDLLQLRELWLGENSLATLPQSLGNLRKLRFIRLCGSPIPFEQQQRLKEMLPARTRFHMSSGRSRLKYPEELIQKSSTGHQ